MALSEKTVVQLRALLKKEGLPVSGKKDELIARLSSKKKIPSKTKKPIQVKKKTSPVKKTSTPTKKKTSTVSPTKKKPSFSSFTRYAQMTPMQAISREVEVTGYLIRYADERTGYTSYIAEEKGNKPMVFGLKKALKLNIGSRALTSITGLPEEKIKTTYDFFPVHGWPSPPKEGRSGLGKTYPREYSVSKVIIRGKLWEYDNEIYLDNPVFVR